MRFSIASVRLKHKGMNMDGLLGMFEEQFRKGEPYREAFRGLLRGDTTGLKKLNAPSLADPQEAVDIATGFAGTIKPVQAKVFQEAFDLAQQRASLPIKEGGLGLPPNNTAMDRARAMGFDTRVYHGTTKAPEEGIKEFDLNLAGKQTGNPNSVLGVFTTPNPVEASRYTKDFGKQEYPSVYPLMMKTGKQYEMPYSEADNLAMQLFYNRENPKALALQRRNELLNKGYDSIKVKINPDEFVSMNPSNIRSVNAAFDPFRRNEPDILAGVAAAPAGLLAIEEEKPKKKRSNK
jgi:hypothetical protein